MSPWLHTRIRTQTYMNTSTWICTHSHGCTHGYAYRLSRTHMDMHRDSHEHTQICTETLMDAHGYAHRLSQICTPTHTWGHMWLCPEAGGPPPGTPGLWFCPVGLALSPTWRAGNQANSSYMASKVSMRITCADVVKTSASCCTPPEARRAWAHLCRPEGPHAQKGRCVCPCESVHISVCASMRVCVHICVSV